MLLSTLVILIILAIIAYYLIQFSLIILIAIILIIVIYYLVHGIDKIIYKEKFNPTNPLPDHPIAPIPDRRHWYPPSNYYYTG
jgi:ABC-type transport system involved in cytochrome bd biosynthesis fused ATPase/permease subunit